MWQSIINNPKTHAMLGTRHGTKTNKTEKYNREN